MYHICICDFFYFCCHSADWSSTYDFPFNALILIAVLTTKRYYLSFSHSRSLSPRVYGSVESHFDFDPCQYTQIRYILFPQCKNKTTTTKTKFVSINKKCNHNFPQNQVAFVFTSRWEGLHLISTVVCFNLLLFILRDFSSFVFHFLENQEQKFSYGKII